MLLVELASAHCARPGVNYTHTSPVDNSELCRFMYRNSSGRSTMARHSCVELVNSNNFFAFLSLALRFAALRNMSQSRGKLYGEVQSKAEFVIQV
jgi:hypothetical protein